MKLRLQLITGAALLAVALSGYGNDRDENVRTGSKSESRSHWRNADRLASPTRASELIGKAVTGSQNEKVGTVDDLAVDLDAGRVLLVVVNVGGVVGVGAKNVALPPQSFSFDPSGKVLRVDADKEKFKSAPEFQMSRWDAAVGTEPVTEIYRSYGQQPYFAGKTPKAAPSSQLGRVEKASKVIGRPVVNNDDKKCGDVNNLIVDLPTGRIVHVILSSGGFLGIGDALNAIPPSALHYTADRDSLHLNMTREELTRAPRFTTSEWPNFGDPNYSREVYRSYGVDPYFSADADNTARNARDRQENRLTPIDQGTSDADVQTTRRIRQEIADREGLSVNARNVKIITANGRVTLRGPVSNEGEKQAIVEIANRIAQGGNVDNQLQVKNQP